jgi:RHS repeat-associated protein
MSFPSSSRLPCTAVLFLAAGLSLTLAARGLPVGQHRAGGANAASGAGPTTVAKTGEAAVIQRNPADAEGFAPVTAARPPAVTGSVRVEPNGGTVYQARPQTFTIWNTGPATATYALAAACEGAAVSCSAGASSVTIAPSASAQVTVTYGIAGAGVVRLTATGPGGSESGWIDVKPLPNSYLSYPRRHLCVTVALPGAAASECGDLRLAHALPGVRTLDRARAPVLLYNSGLAQPRLRVVYNLTPSASKAAPDSVTLGVMLAGGRSLGRQSWRGGWVPGEARRMVYSADAADLATGIYAVNVQTTAWRSGVPTVIDQPADVALVNRSASRFGAGWWVAGLEELRHLANGSKLWVSGDGSAGVYWALNDSTWVAWNPERPDTLKRRVNAQGVPRYVRLLPGGTRLVFGPAGTQDSAVSRVGQTTSFAYGASGLSTITVPGGAVYTFEYGGATRPRLWRVRLDRDTVRRTVEIGTQDGDPRIRGITDPDGAVTTFDYAAADTTQKRITRRMDPRRLTWSAYTYDAAGKVVRGQLDMGAAGEVDDIIVRIDPGESRGAAPVAVPFDSAYTLVDGPRPDADARDVTRFWIPPKLDNSVPQRIVDALGNETVLTYGDARFEMLPTRVDYPVVANGTRRIATATYDARGNPQTSTSVNPLGDGRDATTLYERANAAWPDFVTRVTQPAGEVTDLSYDAVGNRAWVQDGRGAASRVLFDYGAAGQPTSVQDPYGQVETMVYDAAGNLHATRTPLGFWSLAYADALGRDTLVVTPSDTTAFARDTLLLRGTGVRERTVYDPVGRPLLVRTTGPAVRYDRTYTGVPENVEAQTLSVRTTYDLLGLPLATARWATPDSARVDTITTRWRYDAAGRRVAEIAPASPDSAERRDSTVYDPAGNVVRTVDRLGQQVVMAYDALGRLTRRTIPATPDVTGEVEQFTYDAMGNLRSAINSAAIVRRGYLTGGALAADTLEIATEAGSLAGRHRYVTTFGYDLEGRRTGMTVPDSLAPSSTQNQFQYAYDAQTGALRSVADPLGNAYSFAQRLDGALDTLRLPGSIVESYRYDPDGRMTRRLRAHADASWTYALYDDSLAYTPRGKVGYASFLDGSSRMDYDGLGHLAHSFTHDALAHASQDSEEEYRADALGNTGWHRRAGFSLSAEPPQAPEYPVNQFYQRWTGRNYASVKAANATVPGYLRPREDAIRTFDAAGNLLSSVDTTSVRVLYGATISGGSGGRPRAKTAFAYQDEQGQLGASTAIDGVQSTRTAYTYRGDGRLVRVVRTAGCVYLQEQNLCTTQVPDYSTQTRAESYRYDALGRRVWVKTVTPADEAASGSGLCAFRCDNTTRRTIWDGDQVLAEIRYPNGQGEQDTGLDSANVAALAARAERQQTAAGHPYGGPNTSDWAQHGRVLYVHAGGLDQPLGLVRMDYSYDFPAPTLVVPHASWRGVYEDGTILANPVCREVWLPTSEVVYQDSSGHRLQSPVVSGPDSQELDVQQQRCIELDFPGKAMGMRRLLRQNSVAGPITWMGSLVQDNQDASGLMYRRNRFYDPKSGRFTQEDPIGLAGGVNAYGFAAGDPVSYADPYGLRADTVLYDSRETQDSVKSAARRSPTIARAVDQLNHAPNVTVQVHQGTLRPENPGLTSAAYLRNGRVYIDITFDFSRIPEMRAQSRYADHGNVTSADVVGHEIFGHALPFSVKDRCMDDGCAQRRENEIRSELGHLPRTWDLQP